MSDERHDFLNINQVPLGWEPVSDHEADADGAIRHRNELVSQGKVARVVIDTDKALSVWVRTHRNWPVP